jgi:HPr kinase/phosphorylase
VAPPGNRTVAAGTGPAAAPELPDPGLSSADPDAAAPPLHEVIHASCVALEGRGLLILGPSGSGKSALALDLIAQGAGLVADDRCILTRQGGRVQASCPPPLRGLIEARGVGLLRCPAADSAEVVLAIDLGQTEDARLPPVRHCTRIGVPINLVLGPYSRHLSAALLLYLRFGRHA